MSRIDFSPAARRTIVERSNSRCSYLGCGKATCGPDEAEDRALRKGFAAHIYSAAPGGPRGRGGLSDEEIGSPENGIWLCADHAKVIDDNGGRGHPSELLLSYKGLHEARVRGEVLGLYPPMGWILDVQVASGPVFYPGARTRFGKLNLLVGDNGSGKTALCEFLLGAFDARFIEDRWLDTPTPLDIRVSYLRPQATSIRVRTTPASGMRYEIDSVEVPFNPTPLRCIHLPEIQLTSGEDDRALLARTLHLPASQIDRLVDEVNRFPAAKTRNVRFISDEGRPILRADVEGTVPGRSLRALSKREMERVFMEFATAAARVSGRYCPTLLVLDHPFILFNEWFEFYSDHLLAPENQFQTIMCIPTRNMDLDAIRWNGWEVIRTVGTSPRSL